MAGLIEAVVFDVGETIIDESRIWLRWAARLGVPPLTFLGLIGAGIATGRGFPYAFEQSRPGLDIDADRAAWYAAEPDSLCSGFDADDLYPDVRPVLAELQAMGLKVVIAGNQPDTATPALLKMGLPADVIRNSAEMGVEKPDPAFFAAVVGLCGTTPDRIMYVGDRYDNDVLPARAAGMRPVLVRRGPWGYHHAAQLNDDAVRVPVIDSLAELPALIRTET